MSGHSKWATIKRQKAVVDAKKGATYAKMAREIIVATKLGGSDPNANFRLRDAITRAKAEGVPNDNIQRAIEKGAGSGGSDQMEELTYEGYGPGGVAIMVRCATDNRNRTAGDIRSYFSKYGGNMGETGCVNWMFKERGEITLPHPLKLSEDDTLLAALEAGAEDVENEADDFTLVLCQPALLENVSANLTKAGLVFTSAETAMAPLSTVEISDRDAAKQLLKLLDVLENHDDVQTVYTNFEMDQALMQELMAG
ncbi:MAG: YebC/PmpR family DNA-binding transcriptional regulator [Candidatus Obscuribacterales bacterium]|nr:YebC/PmpR family DNA-binding transcriptional regulator [Candidatus Obscuribacterales bacterium]